MRKFDSSFSLGGFFVCFVFIRNSNVKEKVGGRMLEILTPCPSPLKVHIKHETPKMLMRNEKLNVR